MWSIKSLYWICLKDFYMENHNKQKADDKSSQSKSAKKAADLRRFLQCVMDVTLSCGSSLHPVGWRSDFLELCHSPWQFWILVSKPEPGLNQVLRLRRCSLDIFSDYCFRSLRSHPNQNWFMCIFCVRKCFFCTYVFNFVMLVQLHVWFGYVWWSWSHASSYFTLFKTDNGNSL